MQVTEPSIVQIATLRGVRGRWAERVTVTVEQARSADPPTPEVDEQEVEGDAGVEGEKLGAHKEAEAEVEVAADGRTHQA